MPCFMGSDYSWPGTAGSLGQDGMYAYSQRPFCDLVVDKITAKLSFNAGASATARVKMGIYSTRIYTTVCCRPQPDELLAGTETWAGTNSSPVWHEFTIQGKPLHLNRGQLYWIVYFTEYVSAADRVFAYGSGNVNETNWLERRSRSFDLDWLTPWSESVQDISTGLPAVYAWGRTTQALPGRMSP